MAMSGQEAPVSQLLTVLLETPRRSATSCCVYPFDLRKMAINSPIEFLGMILSPFIFAIILSHPDKKGNIFPRKFVRQAWNNSVFAGICKFQPPRMKVKNYFLLGY